MVPPQRGVAILGVGNIEGMLGKQQAQTCAHTCVPPAARPPTSPGPRAQGGPRAQRCASWARNPKGPKSHLFVTNWVAIQPFCTSEAGFDAKFRRGSRQIGPTPSNSTFFGPFLEKKNHQKSRFGAFWVQQIVKRKSRLRGWDLSGEIRAGIWRRLVLVACKTVGWRPDWLQKGVIWGPWGSGPG